MLLSFLQNICYFKFISGKVHANYKGKEIVNEKSKSPGVYKITYNNEYEIIDIDVLN